LGTHWNLLVNHSEATGTRSEATGTRLEATGTRLPPLPKPQVLVNKHVINFKPRNFTFSNFSALKFFIGTLLGRVPWMAATQYLWAAIFTPPLALSVASLPSSALLFSPFRDVVPTKPSWGIREAGYRIP
jgi:hypothetical protein